MWTQGLLGRQTLHLRNPIRHTYKHPHLEFPLQSEPLMVLQMSKAAGWGYYFGTEGMNSVYQDMLAGCHNSLPSSLSQSDSQWMGAQIPLQSL